MDDSRLIPVVYGLCLLLWLASGQMRDARLRRLARQGAFGLLALGMLIAVVQLALWLAR
jgi:hypothetical protein